ncbi:MAG: ATP-binding protein [Bryobacteraceae bacterium]|jgi:heavy metal sensor kinase
MTIRSFRLRLTAWYLLLFSLLFVAFSAFLYGVLSNGLRERVDETLGSEAGTAAGMYEDELSETHGDRQASAAEAVAGARFAGTVVAVVAEGRVLAASTRSPEGDLAAVAARAAAAGSVTAFPQYGKYGARAAARRAGDPGRQVLILALLPLDAIAAELRTVRRALFVALPLILGLAGLGGFLLATRSLEPLASMARQAHEIGDSSLHKRLEIGGAAEELQVLAASFNALLARLDQSFETMRRFVADASHELRTPLAVIRGEADVALTRERGAEEYRESLAVILDESRRLSRLVDDLLNLARADSGHVPLVVREFYFNDLLAECCRSALAGAAALGIEVECLAPRDAPFRGDEDLLRRLVMNLLDNAIRYTPRGGQVSAALEQSPGYIQIRISDTGTGIAPEDAARVFERFYRADQARSRQDGGFGLGLSIVQWIAEAHRGTVKFSSQLGAGSVFTVTLPL